MRIISCGRRSRAFRRRRTRPDARELCEKTGIAYEDAVMAVAAAGEVESLSKPVYEGMGKRSPDGSACGTVCRQHLGGCRKNRLVDRMLLKQLIDELPEQEKILIRLRYYEDQTQAQIAKNSVSARCRLAGWKRKILIRMRERSGV